LGSALFGPRENMSVRGLWNLAVACHCAAELRRGPVAHIHSQWAHGGATVALYAASLLGTGFSFTGHAADLFRERPANAPVRILPSGRLVEKKGFAVLIDALALLRDRGVPFEAIIAGSGPLEDTLRAQITARGLSDRITLTGASITQEDLPTFMAQGDIDGLPMMLMEAMACGMPAVSTDLVGIPDLVIDGKTGLLVPQRTRTPSPPLWGGSRMTRTMPRAWPWQGMPIFWTNSTRKQALSRFCGATVLNWKTARDYYPNPVPSEFCWRRHRSARLL
jgi:hypothetical protein